ncbi:MAG: hypothetical protein RLZZ479_1388 [Bacteroidota bacterium]|jgi:hypothetical protein
MYLEDSEDDEIIIKFSSKKVTIDESKNTIHIFNEEAPPKSPKYVLPFQRK